MLDADVHAKLAKANELAKIVQALHKRIGAFLDPICNDFIDRGDRASIKTLIDSMPPGAHRDGMIVFLESMPAISSAEMVGFD